MNRNALQKVTDIAQKQLAFALEKRLDFDGC